MEDTELTIYPRLKGKNVFITGASAGIGWATAVHFAACGSNLVLVARRLDRLEELKKKLEAKYHVNIFVYQLDARNRDEWAKLLTVLPEEFSKKIDILVNNAGKALSFTPLSDYKLEQINEMVDVNVNGVIWAIQSIVPDMKTRGVGHIINLGSIGGKETYAGGSIYCATKHALEALSDSLRHELVGTPLRVTKICPGAVNTEFSLVRYGTQELADKVYEGFEPLKAEDIADNIVYCASRPANVQIADFLVFPTSQAGSGVFHRKPK